MSKAEKFRREIQVEGDGATAASRWYKGRTFPAVTAITHITYTDRRTGERPITLTLRNDSGHLFSIHLSRGGFERILAAHHANIFDETFGFPHPPLDE